MSLASRNMIVEAEQLLQEEFARWVENECVPTLKACTPKKTGALRNSIHAEKLSDKMYWVGTHMYYGKYVESGRGPVSPKLKRALYWPDILGGRPVAHAGPAKAQHIVEKAISQLN